MCCVQCAVCSVLCAVCCVLCAVCCVLCAVCCVLRGGSWTLGLASSEQAGSRRRQPEPDVFIVMSL